MKYVYSVDIDATMTEGVYSEPAGVPTFTPGSVFNNPEFANDQNIEFAVTGVSNNECLRFVNSVIKTGDSLAIFVSSGTATVTIRKDSGLVFVASGAVGAGWNVIDFGSDKNATQWFIVFSNANVLQFNEVFITKIFTFPYGYNLGNSFSKIYGVDSVANASGDEFTNKRHASKWVRTWGWRNFSQDNIDDLEDFDEAVDGVRAKFLWHDDTKYWWVKQTVGLNYTEAGYLAFDPSSGLRQQLF